MPSLVYITRVEPFSAEQAHALESSGLHVLSFGPGEITADACILVMTSEAALAGVQKAGLAPAAGDGRIHASAPATVPPLHHIGEHLGADAAIWNRIKAAGSGNSETRPVSGEQSSPPPAVTTAASLGFVASQSGSRVLAASRQKAAAAKFQSTAPRKAAESDLSSREPGMPGSPAGVVIIEAEPVSPRWFRRVSFLAGIHGWGGFRSRRFWEPAAAACTLLILAMVLLAVRAARLPSPAQVAAADNSNRAERSASGAVGLTEGQPPPRSPVQATNRQEPSAKPSPLAAESRRRESDQDFVAKDFITRFDRQGHRGTTLQAPDLRSGVHNRLVPRRVVVD